MNATEAAAPRVVAVLLADGWHQIEPGSFSVGPMALSADADLGMAGFRFEEADAGRPYRPAVLAGPLDSIIAVRQINPGVLRGNDLDRARAAQNGRRTNHGQRLLVRTSGSPA